MKSFPRITINFFLLTIFLFNGCKPDFKPAQVNAGFAVLTYPLYLGGDFMSGYSDGALSNAGQHNSIPYLLNQQLTKVGIITTYNQHFVSVPNGYGLNFPYDSPKYCSSFHLGYKTDCMGVNSLFPLNTLIDSTNAAINSELIYYQTGTYYSVEGIPYAKIIDYTDNSLGTSYGKNPYYPQIASAQNTSTMLSDALAQPFTFFVLWAGMEDIYQYAQRGGEIEPLTDFAAFDSKFDEVLDDLIASSGAHGVVANIPDLDVFPFFTYIPWNGLVITQADADNLNIFRPPCHFDSGANGFLILDPTAVNNYRLLNSDEYILLSVPTDSLKCDFMGSLGPIAGHFILTRTEIANINAAIQHFNAKIQAAAVAHNIPVVDMNSFFRKVKNGYYYDGIKFSSEFIKGAFFSLDGYHPTAQGYGLLTNEFIKTINGFYHSTIPLVDVTHLPGIIFP